MCLAEIARLWGDPLFVGCKDAWEISKTVFLKLYYADKMIKILGYRKDSNWKYFVLFCILRGIYFMKIWDAFGELILRDNEERS